MCRRPPAGRDGNWSSLSRFQDRAFKSYNLKKQKKILLQEVPWQQAPIRKAEKKAKGSEAEHPAVLAGGAAGSGPIW